MTMFVNKATCLTVYLKTKTSQKEQLYCPMEALTIATKRNIASNTNQTISPEELKRNVATYGCLLIQCSRNIKRGLPGKQGPPGPTGTSGPIHDVDDDGALVGQDLTSCGFTTPCHGI